MSVNWMKERGCVPQNLTKLGIPTLLVALLFVGLGTQMNGALEAGSNTFFGVQFNEIVCFAILILGSVLMGMSIVFNMVGIGQSRCRD